MQTNILSYVCFFVLCSLVVCDMWFFSSVVLQIICLILVCVVCGLVGYIAHKWHKGTYLSTEQQNNLRSYLSENITLRNELAHIKQKAKQTAVGGVELQQIVLFNKRLTYQNSNLKTHIQTLTEQLQTAKNSKQTAVVPITPNEQQTIKKSKTA